MLRFAVHSLLFSGGLIPSNERTYKVNVDGKPTQRPLQTSQFSVARVPVASQ